MKFCINIQKEDAEKIITPEELARCILDGKKETDKISDGEKAKMDAKIMAKLQSGKKLSPKELDYLRRTNPIMYAHAMRIQRMAEAVENQLKHAKSKEEVNRIISSALGGVSKNDPVREYIYAAINRISAEFHNSGAYGKLPDTIEEGKKKNKESGDDFSGAEDDEDDGFDVNNWSPLTEAYDSLPGFSVKA